MIDPKTLTYYIFKYFIEFEITPTTNTTPTTRTIMSTSPTKIPLNVNNA